jgi:hypothetical protein
MTYPVLMISVVPLRQWTAAGPLPDVPANTAFWADDSQVNSLITGNLAVEAPPNTVAPPPEPPHTVNGVPGLAAATSNASH